MFCDVILLFTDTDTYILFNILQSEYVYAIEFPYQTYLFVHVTERMYIHLQNFILWKEIDLRQSLYIRLNLNFLLYVFCEYPTLI